MTLITDPLWLGVVGHRGRLGTAGLAEDLAAVPAMVLPVRQGEGARASAASRHFGVVFPFSASLLGQLNLFWCGQKRKST